MDHPHSFSCKLELGSDQEIPSDWYPFVTMECEIMGAVVSQTRVKSLGTVNDIQPQKHVTSWTRYHCQVRWESCTKLGEIPSPVSGNYRFLPVFFQVEVEKKWIETESQKQSSCMTQWLFSEQDFLPLVRYICQNLLTAEKGIKKVQKQGWWGTFCLYLVSNSSNHT